MRRYRATVRSCVLLAALAAGCGRAATRAPAPAPAPSPGPPPVGDRGAFVVRLGGDTIGAEQFAWSALRLTATSVVRTPGTLVRRYTVALRPDGSVARFEVTAQRSDVAVPPQRITMAFAEDTVTVATQIGDSTTGTVRVPVGEGYAMPYVGSSFALLELATRRLRRGGGADSVPLALLVGTGRVLPATVRRGAGDTALVTFPGDSPYRARTDAEGRIVELIGSATQRVVVTRTDSLNVDALADAAPLGTLSPTDTVTGRAGSATLTVVYGRPSRRGRTILGNVVPYDSVWRTGANAATVFTTSANVTIGGTRVPRGSYTLWTLPTRDGWQLIVNRQTGQWGTEYDASRDLARIPMVASPAAERVDRFTIAMDSTSRTAARLRLRWDDFEASVPVVRAAR